MGPARIYPWRKMRRSRAPSIAPGTFFVAQSWADCITNMAGFNLRQAQVAELDGPPLFARIGIMKAINRHVERLFDPSRKDKHWGTAEAGRSMTSPT